MDPARRRLRLPFRLDLWSTLVHLRRGRLDPTMRLSATEVWRATRTPEGPATLHLDLRDGAVEAEAWGAGRLWALEAMPDLVGAGDDPGRLVARDPVVRRLARRLPGLRLARTRAVVEALVPAVLEQRITGGEARRAFAQLVDRFGEPAPGAGGLRLPPAPEVLAALPYYELHPLGIERRRADVLRSVGGRAARLEETVSMAGADAARRLASLPGIGRWTVAEVAGRAFGDPDAVPVGDFHIPNLVSWALAGEPRGSDGRMLELLEPYRGQRGRVVRLLEAGHTRPPRYGPRVAVRSIARI